MSDPIVSFTLPKPTKTLNEIRAMDFRTYAKHRRMLASEVWVRTLKQKLATPLPKARIRIERYGTRDVDIDGLYGGLKPLLDVLQPFHANLRPDGLGFIASDAPSCLVLEVVPVRSTAGSTKTIVQIFGVPA